MYYNKGIRSGVHGALYFFELGFKVFPLKTNSKLPLFSGWQEWAETATYEKIQQFGIANPTCNWGVIPGRDWTVIDIDNKPDKNGRLSMQDLEAEHGKLPNTLFVTTPSEGEHLYLRNDDQGANQPTVGKLGIGIDTRGIGSYVVAPGSKIDGVFYQLNDEYPIAKRPTWIADLLNEAKKEPPKTLNDGELVEEGERNTFLTSIAGSMRRRGLGYEEIIATLMAVNENRLTRPEPLEELETIARSICNYAPEKAQTASVFLNQKIKTGHGVRKISEVRDNIPPRDWVMERKYIGGNITVTVAPGGVGKSTMALLDAFAIASNKPLSGFDIMQQGRVWVHNAEDSAEELERRLKAMSIHHGLPVKDLDDKIHFSSGEDIHLMFARSGIDGVEINQEAIDYAVNYILENKIKVFIADPFVRLHGCLENDNMQIDKVVYCFQQITKRTGCAIGLVHHTNKSAFASGSDPEDMNKARGASALVNAARIVYNLGTKTKKDANALGVPESERRQYLRLDNAKGNLQPPPEYAHWFKKHGILLNNGDSVGSLELAGDLAGRVRDLEKESKGYEMADFSICLYDILKVGDCLPLPKVVRLIDENKKFSHLFKELKSDWRKQKLLIDYLIETLSHRDKVFKYVEKNDKRPKHWVLASINEDWQEKREEELNDLFS